MGDFGVNTLRGKKSTQSLGGLTPLYIYLYLPLYIYIYIYPYHLYYIPLGNLKTLFYLKLVVGMGCRDDFYPDRHTPSHAINALFYKSHKKKTYFCVYVSPWKNYFILYIVDIMLSSA